MTAQTMFCILRHILGCHRTVTIPGYLTKSLSTKHFIDETLTNDDLAEMELNPFSSASIVQKTYLENLKPPIKRSYNLAAYVNSSRCLQQLVKLGVSLYDIENLNRGAAKHIASLNFDRDCIPYIKFLVNHGLKNKNLGRFISEYPTIFQVSIDELETRINFLVWRRFTIKQISQALNRSSQIIYHTTKGLNMKLDQIQSEFALTDHIMRSIIAKYPPVISLPNSQYKLTNFTLIEEFGFTLTQMHTILEAQPYLMDIIRPALIDRLDLIHNQVGLTHEMITNFPKLITGPRFDIKYRSDYLKKLKRDQFNPEKPLYVPPSALYNGTDEEFCRRFARTNLDDYKLFIKSR